MLQDLVLSQQFCWRFAYSDTLRHVDCEIRETFWRNMVPVVWAQAVKEKWTTWLWRWRHCDTSKCQ